ncbi:MAG: hypothetical protein ACMUIS_06770 [bacterium]
MTQLIQHTITCPRCSSPLSPQIFAAPSDASCPHCGLVMTGRLYPRFFKTKDMQETAADVTAGSESSCYYHPEKLAVSLCSECGRFLCSLCELDIQNRIVCPTCLEKLDQEKRVSTFTNEVTFRDAIALNVAVVLTFFWPIYFVTAPFTLFYIWRHFKEPKQYIIPRKRWRFYLAGLIAGAQLAVWAILFIGFISGI